MIGIEYHNMISSKHLYHTTAFHLHFETRRCSRFVLFILFREGVSKESSASVKLNVIECSLRHARSGS